MPRRAANLAIALIGLLAAGQWLAGCAPGPLKKDDQALFTAAHQNFQAGRYQEADRQFTQVISHRPDPAALCDLYYFRGLSRLKLNQRSAAKEDFRRGAALAGQPQSQIFNVTALANLEFEDGRDAAAIPLYRRALANRVPDLPVDAIMYRFATSLQRTGQWLEGDEILARLASEYPKSPFTASARQRFQASCFTVQAGAFAERRNADTLAAKLTRQGHAVTVSITTAARPLHVVSVGQYRTWAEASKVAAALKSQGLQAVVKP